ncbi:MAG: RES domain-containing protein [Pseudomonadota bacterium]
MAFSLRLPFTNTVYRALKPRWHKQPLSGEGASKHGGRFNPVGMPTIYTALDELTALAEANQIGDHQPTTLVAYRTNFSRVFDATNSEALQALGFGHEDILTPDWRMKVLSGITPRTHDVTAAVLAKGYDAMLVRSFAPKAKPNAINLVIWRWNTSLDNHLTVIDKEGRLK